MTALCPERTVGYEFTLPDTGHSSSNANDPSGRLYFAKADIALW
ncbi:MAG TPA: hypothetical protein VIF82_03680 [Burkholderiaceae bacterium]|jgi:hypothetical protein